MLSALPQLLLTLTLSPLIVSANGLVLHLFARSPRLLRVPSNLLLLFLAASDLVPGVLLVPAALGAASSSLTSAAPSSLMLSCRVPAAALAACETFSLLFVVAVAVDKVVSLAKPLTYAELVTKRALYAFAAAAAGLAAAVGGLTLYGSGRWSHRAGATCEAEFRSTVSVSVQCLVLFAMVLPGAAVVCCCCLYVYTVASRHARDIRKVQTTVRNKAVGDSRYNTTNVNVNVDLLADHQQPSGCNNGPPAANGCCQQGQPPTARHLLVPGSPGPRLNRLSSSGGCSGGAFFPSGGGGEAAGGPSSNASSYNHHNNSEQPLQRPPSSASTSSKRARLNYASALGLTILSFFLCRLPKPLCFVVLGLSSTAAGESQAQQMSLIAHLSCLPFLLSCALNPWLYAYHNLDLKPLMRRHLRRQARRLGMLGTNNSKVAVYNGHRPPRSNARTNHRGTDFYFGDGERASLLLMEVGGVRPGEDDEEESEEVVRGEAAAEDDAAAAKVTGEKRAPATMTAAAAGRKRRPQPPLLPKVVVEACSGEEGSGDQDRKTVVVLGRAGSGRRAAAGRKVPIITIWLDTTGEGEEGDDDGGGGGSYETAV